MTTCSSSTVQRASSGTDVCYDYRSVVRYDVNSTQMTLETSEK